MPSFHDEKVELNLGPSVSVGEFSIFTVEQTRCLRHATASTRWVTVSRQVSAVVVFGKGRIQVFNLDASARSLAELSQSVPELGNRIRGLVAAGC